jgi:hypothetical protein
MKLFLTAFLQVFLVAANTLFIARLFYPGVAIAGFSISFFWSYNVKRISIGSLRDRLVYCSGAMCGGLSGVFVANLF